MERSQQTRRKALGLAACVLALVALVACSLAVGTKSIGLGVVRDAFLHYDANSNDHVIVRSLRLPRTEVGLAVGIALGLAGTVMQGVSRNPLADPGILGINAGAALFVVLGIFVLGVSSVLGYVWFAFAGAAVAAIVVATIGSIGRGATPVRLALAGAAVTALLGSLTSTVLLLDQASLDQYRFWAVGSLDGREPGIVLRILPFLLVGAVLALASAPGLDALAMGDDVARALGQNVARARVLSLLAVVLLVGGATSIAGPIAFVGLTVPHIARAIAGPAHKWLLPFAAVLAPMLLLGADVLGRVVARPAEVQVGIVTAVVGAPVFIALVRRTGSRSSRAAVA